MVSTSPRPLLVYCAYALCLVQDAAEDARREREFWDHRSEQTFEVDCPDCLFDCPDCLFQEISMQG